MINLNEKQDIILTFLREGLSQREISRHTGITRDTIRKYVKYYEDKLKELGYDLNEIDKVNLIEDIVEPPKYKSSPRVKIAVTDEIIKRLQSFLKDNENKRLIGLYKQYMKKIDTYEVLIEEGQNTAYFLEARAYFFKEIKDSFRTVIYDNAKVAIKNLLLYLRKSLLILCLSFLYIINLNIDFVILIVVMKKVMLKEVLK